jgi:hypothetical protein
VDPALPRHRSVGDPWLAADRGLENHAARGQIEAATALGLGRYRIERHIIWPQALLVALRPLGNELIAIIKASALAAIVTLLDLMGQTRFVFARTFDFSVYLYAAIMYLALTETIRRIWNRVERSLGSHLERKTPGRHLERTVAATAGSPMPGSAPRCGAVPIPRGAQR